MSGHASTVHRSFQTDGGMRVRMHVERLRIRSFKTNTGQGVPISSPSFASHNMRSQQCVGRHSFRRLSMKGRCS
jgi:hypothetical protein